MQNLNAYLEGTQDPALMSRVSAFEALENLPAIASSPYREPARLIRYYLLHDEQELVIKAMAHDITHAEIWIALAGLN